MAAMTLSTATLEKSEIFLDGRERGRSHGREARRADADLAQFLNGVLRGFRLELSRRRDVGNERHVHTRAILRPELDLELAQRFEKRQRLDVTYGATDFDDGEVGVARAGDHARFDFVGDVRNDLHRRSEVLAAPLFGDDRFVDTSGREVALPVHPGVREALVVPEIEISFGAVVGNENFPVLVGGHRSGVHVDVRVELDVRDPQAACFHQGADRSRGEPLSDRRDDPARHHDELRSLAHRSPPSAG